MHHESKKLRLLAFGDSITEGYSKGGTLKHPYSIELQRLLDFHKYDAEVVEAGVSGERVVTGMTERLAGILQNATAAGHQYDHLLLLGGVNDLFMETDTASVFNGIVTMLRAAIANGMTVTVLTVMESAFIPLGSKQDEQRVVLNHRIRLVPAHPDFEKSVTVLDLDIGLPYKESNMAGFFDDGLHLTAGGYDWLGQLVYKSLLPELKKRNGHTRIFGGLCWILGCS
ncbi:MAG: hypothetical protein WDW36_004617 [Sanguina aurantia]